MITDAPEHKVYRVVFIYRFATMMYTKSANVLVRPGRDVRYSIPRRLIELADVVYVEHEHTTIKTRSYDGHVDHMRVDELEKWVEDMYRNPLRSIV